MRLGGEGGAGRSQPVAPNRQIAEGASSQTEASEEIQMSKATSGAEIAKSKKPKLEKPKAVATSAFPNAPRTPMLDAKKAK